MITNDRQSDHKGEILVADLKMVAWEITRTCNLLCAHCRGSSSGEICEEELSINECFRLIDEILTVAKPVIILTGGEPLLRQDMSLIAEYAVRKGLRVVIGTNGTLINDSMAAQLKKIPVSRLGISIDFPVAELQDRFRGQVGAFQAAMNGISAGRNAGLEIQINSTITKMNINYLEELLALALDLQAVAFHPFLLVPTGRGKGLGEAELTAEQYEETLNWVFRKQREMGDKISFKATDAPHFQRIVRQKCSTGIDCYDGQLNNPVAERSGKNAARGCMAGTGFCFISSTGKVKGCGYLDIEAGDIRKEPFRRIWHDSYLFNQLRDLSGIKGKCGICEFKKVCGGCRARAYEKTGDFLEAEPYCIYQPPASLSVRG